MKTPEKVLITDKLYIVVVECLLYLFYYSKRLYLLFISAQCKEREVMGTLCFFLMCLIDMNKLFEKHLWPLKHSLHALLNIVSIIINIHLHKASKFVQAHVD